MIYNDWYTLIQFFISLTPWASGLPVIHAAVFLWCLVKRLLNIILVIFKNIFVFVFFIKRQLGSFLNFGSRNKSENINFHPMILLSEINHNDNQNFSFKFFIKCQRFLFPFLNLLNLFKKSNWIDAYFAQVYHSAIDNSYLVLKWCVSIWSVVCEGSISDKATFCKFAR